MDTLCKAIDALDSVDRGFSYHAADTPTRYQSFADLGDSVRDLANRLDGLGHSRGSRIILILADQARFVHGFLAVIRAGLVAVPFHPPTLTESTDHYLARLQRLQRLTDAREILVEDRLHERLQGHAPCIAQRRWSDCLNLPGSGRLSTAVGAQPALIQFTSGSTGTPRGVEISHTNLVSNARAIQQALQVDPSTDCGLSWLPLHHDMGLIGFLVTPILTQTASHFLSPTDFARQPLRWPALISQTRATISYAPNFGYHHVCRSLERRGAGSWDLSHWRVAGCGGEPISEQVLSNFAEQLSPCGFSANAFVPSYGLAEATVAVTLGAPSGGVRTHRLPTPVDTRADTDGNRRSVCCGRPIRATEIRIVDEQGRVVEATSEGQIQVRGPGVAQRFWQTSGTCSATDADGWLDTGDRGWLIDGELHVSGRSRERILINGRNHYPQDIEACACSLEGIRRGRVAAIGRPGTGSEELVLLVEVSASLSNALSGDAAPGHDLVRQLRRRIREQLGLAVADVCLVRRGTITRTRSGKLRRRALRQRYLDKTFLDGSQAEDSSAEAGVPPASGAGSSACTRASRSLSC